MTSTFAYAKLRCTADAYWMPLVQRASRNSAG